MNIKMPEHIAIILDGNRRWAKQRNMPSILGHKEGVKNLEEMVRFLDKQGLKYLTVYAFSTENFKRSKEEVTYLMKIFNVYMDKIIKKDDFNIKINILGTKDGLSKDLINKIEKVEEKTKNNTGLIFNIAFNYGGRHEIIDAVNKILEDGNIKSITEEEFSKFLYTKDMKDPDLLIRTSGEKRLSNFLLWQLAYTEFYFSKKMWPEFKKEDMIEAIIEYNNRNRRYGGN